MGLSVQFVEEVLVTDEVGPEPLVLHFGTVVNFVEILNQPFLLVLQLPQLELLQHRFVDLEQRPVETD